MNLKENISRIITEYIIESKDEDIQLLIDIIDGLDSNDDKKIKYINLLKNKYNYDYIIGNDEEYINNPDLNDIKTINDFKNFKNYKIYAERLLRLREKNIDYSKFYNYKPTTVDKKTLINLLEKYKIKSFFTKKGSISSPIKDEMSIDWAGNIFDKSHILHEIGHFFDDDIIIPITYSLTDYGLTNQKECTCESIMLFLLNKEYYISILPDIGGYIDKNLPAWVTNLSIELLNAK